MRLAEDLEAGGIDEEAETNSLNKGPILCGLIDDDDNAVRADVGFRPLPLDHRLGQSKGIGCGALLGRHDVVALAGFEFQFRCRVSQKTCG